MRFIITLLFIAFTSLGFSQKASTLYVTNFETKSIMIDPNLSEEVADDFEIVLSLCKNKYSLNKRNTLSEDIRKIEDFEDKKEALEEVGINYIFYGDITYNTRTKDYELEYYFEELNTASILVIDKVLFNSEIELKNRSIRISRIQLTLMRNEMICKKIDSSIKPELAYKGKGLETQNKDTDKDGVPDLVDKEPFSEPGAMVDDRGVTVTSKDFNKPIIRTKGVSTRTLVDEMYPTLPSLSFEVNSAEIQEKDHAKLHQIGLLLKQYPTLYIEVEGIDQTDDNTAADRAFAARDYLIEYYNVNKNRLIIKHRVAEIKNGVVLFNVKEEL